MRRLLFVIWIVCGLGLLLVAGYVAAQGGGDEAEYWGARECSSCHRDLRGPIDESNHARALQAVGEDSEGLILADFGQGELERLALLPGEDAPRAFTAADIAYVLGAGRYAQAYLVEAEEGYLVLPARWNTVEGRWQRLELAANWPDAAYAFGPNCAFCHTAGLETATYTWVDDGVQCESCHGPGSNHINAADDAGNRPSDEESAAIRAAIFNQPDAQMCGQCHNRGAAPDGHPYPAGYHPGTDLLAEAVYTLYGPEDTAHWWASGQASQPNMQFNEWLGSAHAAAPGQVLDTGADPACLTCHSADYNFINRRLPGFEDGYYGGQPPDPLTVETAQYGLTCQQCHNPHSEEDYPLFLLEEPYALCVSCHSNASFSGEGLHHPAQEMYEGLPLVEEVEAVPSAHFTAEDGPDCLTCHMPRLPAGEGERSTHALNLVLPGEAAAAPEVPDACTGCHSEAVDAAGMQRLIDDVQANIATRLEAARAAAADSAPEWVTAALDFIAGDGSEGIHNYAYTSALLGAVELELGLTTAAPLPSTAPYLGTAAEG